MKQYLIALIIFFGIIMSITVGINTDGLIGIIMTSFGYAELLALINLVIKNENSI